MSWYLMPSGQPWYATDGGYLARILTDKGALLLDDSEVEEAIDAWNAGTAGPEPGPYDFLLPDDILDSGGLVKPELLPEFPDVSAKADLDEDGLLLLDQIPDLDYEPTLVDGKRAVRRDDLALRGTEHGITSDGVTNDVAALVTAVGDAHTAKRELLLEGDVLAPSNVTLTSPVVRLRGTPGARIVCAGVGNGVTIGPPGVPAGHVDAAAAGATIVKIDGAGWTVDEHVGKWVLVFDPILNPLTGDPGDPTAHRRRVLANTDEELTLEHAIGYPIPAGCAATFFTPLEVVDLRGLTIDRSVLGGANLVIEYVKRLITDDVHVLNSGDYGDAVGNAVSIYQVDGWQGNITVQHAGNFGVFVYNSDHIRAYTTVGRFAGQFGVQYKDCRDVKAGGHVEGDGTVGQAAFNVKCSGLNPAYDCTLVDPWASKSTASDYEFSSLTAEGTVFAARNFSVVRGTSHKSGGQGFSHITDAGSLALGIDGWVWERCVAREADTIGFGPSVPFSKLLHCNATRCRFEAVSVLAPDVHLVGGVFKDNVQAYVSGLTRSSEILIGAAAHRTLLDGVQFQRTVLAKSVRLVRELAGATGTLIKDPKALDIAGAAALTQDYLLSGAGSVAIGRREVDSFTGTPTINKKPYLPLVATATLDFGSVAAAGGTQALTVPVVGAAVGDVVAVGRPTTLNAGLVAEAYVSATDVVTVRLTNTTVAAIDPASASYKVAVSKA